MSSVLFGSLGWDSFVDLIDQPVCKVDAVFIKAQPPPRIALGLLRTSHLVSFHQVADDLIFLSFVSKA